MKHGLYMNFKSKRENHQMYFTDVATAEVLWCECGDCEECLANEAEAAIATQAQVEGIETFVAVRACMVREAVACIELGFTWELYVSYMEQWDRGDITFDQASYKLISDLIAIGETPQ